MKQFEPMLAATCEDVKTLKFPLLASYKLDGIRALVIGGQVMSRNLKPIPNPWIQRTFGGLPEGTDGELIFGDPTHPEAFRTTASALMSEDGEPVEVCYHIFDNYLSPGGFAQRFRAVERAEPLYSLGVIVVPHMTIDNVEELNEFEAAALDAGYEGVMVRALDGLYKYGRSTAKQGWLLKVKRFEDAEAVVLGTEELMHNKNEAHTDATGHTERSSHQANLVASGTLGALCVRGVKGKYDGVEFKIGTGFTAAQRKELWQNRGALVGRLAKFKFFPTGSKDKPRFPVWLGWRPGIDA